MRKNVSQLAGLVMRVSMSDTHNNMRCTALASTSATHSLTHNFCWRRLLDAVLGEALHGGTDTASDEEAIMPIQRHPSNLCLVCRLRCWIVPGNKATAKLWQSRTLINGSH